MAVHKRDLFSLGGVRIGMFGSDVPCRCVPKNGQTGHWHLLFLLSSVAYAAPGALGCTDTVDAVSDRMVSVLADVSVCVMLGATGSMYSISSSIGNSVAIGSSVGGCGLIQATFLPCGCSAFFSAAESGGGCICSISGCGGTCCSSSSLPEFSSNLDYTENKRCLSSSISESITLSTLCTMVIALRVSNNCSVQFILFAFVNYSTKLHIIIIHLAGSPGSYFAYLKDCLKKRSGIASPRSPSAAPLLLWQCLTPNCMSLECWWMRYSTASALGRRRCPALVLARLQCPHS